MADLIITIPDDQLANMETRLDPSGEPGEDTEDKAVHVQTSIQQIINNWVWEAARNAAANAVANPTE